MPDRIEEQETKRNYRLFVWNGIFITVAFAFVSPSIVLSAFIYKLTASSFYVGLVNTIMISGWIWPQLVISNLVEHRERKKPFYFFPAMLRIAGWIAITASTLRIGNRDPHALLWTFLILFAFYASAGGVSIVPFMDIVAKIVPVQQRARLFSLRRLWGGSLAFLAGLLIRYVLSESSGLSFPVNYGVLFGCATLFVALSVIAFLQVQEPIHPVAETRNSFSDHLVSGVRILRDDRNYRRLLAARTFWSLGMMGIPFYVPYAVSQLGIHEATTGLFLSVSMISAVLSNLLWMRIGSKSSRIILEWSVIFMLLSALMAALMRYIPDASFVPFGSLRTTLYFVVFAASGVGVAGINLANMTYLLEIAPSQIRPRYVGFMNTFSLPLAFVPTLAGGAIHYVSYQPMFLIAVFFCVAAIFTIKRLKEMNHE